MSIPINLPAAASFGELDPEVFDEFDPELPDQEWLGEIRPRRASAFRRPVFQPRPPGALPRPIPPVRPGFPRRPWLPPRAPGVAVLPWWVREPQLPPPEPAGTASGQPGAGEPPTSEHELIRWVQDSLNRLLNLRLPVHGILDAPTRSAVRSFQARAGLPVTGIISPDTERALQEALASLTPPAAELAWESEVIDLDRAVRQNRAYARSLGWQNSFDRIVALLGFTDRTPDESSFAQAVARWQKAQGLTSDGIIGPGTWGKMQQLLQPAALAADRPAWIDWIASPYHSSRRGHPITSIIYHFTAGPSLEGTVRWFQNNPKQVSAHYVIGKDGRIVQMVPLDRAAHHAGPSSLPGCRGGVNRCSIGIEIVNWGRLTKRGDKFYTYSGRLYAGPPPVLARGQFWEPFTEAQYGALLRLTKYLLSLYPGITHITGHEDIAPGRKNDPGGAFAWQWIKSGLGSTFTGHVGPLTGARAATAVAREWQGGLGSPYPTFAEL